MLSRFWLLKLTVPCEDGDLHKIMTKLLVGNDINYLTVYEGHVTLALSARIIC